MVIIVAFAEETVFARPRLRGIGWGNNRGCYGKEWLKNQIIENTNYAYHQGTDKPEFTE
jgi:hypothetical protein